MRTFGHVQLEYLFLEAELSSRKRHHLNLHSSFDDKIQRLYIAMLKGSYVEPHYHEFQHQWEMFTILQGVVKLKLYNLDGTVRESLLLGEGYNVHSMELQSNEIHSVECISERALIFEIKEGPFVPELAKQFPAGNLANWNDL